MASRATRRALLLSGRAAAIALLLPGSSIPAGAQNAAADAGPVDPGRFLAFAYSSAMLQERASALAASKDTRPEVKEFAREMARFRGQQLSQLRAIAQERGLTLPAEEEFEHRVVLENLEPLDYLALSRRYAEVQLQALAQEIRGYEAAEQGADEGMKRLAAEMLPQVRQRLEAARRIHDSVKP
jgi:predicted outer membrane protein